VRRGGFARTVLLRVCAGLLVMVILAVARGNGARAATTRHEAGTTTDPAITLTNGAAVWENEVASGHSGGSARYRYLVATAGVAAKLTVTTGVSADVSLLTYRHPDPSRCSATQVRYRVDGGAWVAFSAQGAEAMQAVAFTVAVGAGAHVVEVGRTGTGDCYLYVDAFEVVTVEVTTTTTAPTTTTTTTPTTTTTAPTTTTLLPENDPGPHERVEFAGQALAGLGFLVFFSGVQTVVAIVAAAKR
jgi:hypothetical protein